jgi:hypothetical protein
MNRTGNFTSVFFALLLGCFVNLGAVDVDPAYPNFKNNPYLTGQMQEMMAPYLLPLDHPMKARLDAIFSHSRVIENLDALVDAGFSIVAGPMPISFVVVARHPHIPGYVFKLYPDSEKRSRKQRPHWQSLTTRCYGAREIKKIIERERIHHFTVPDKWLYILPIRPFSSSLAPEPVILMETDMELESRHVTKEKWKSGISREHLDELYAILKHGYGGNGTTYLSRNVPFTKRGTFAFTDTESQQREVNLEHVKIYLSKEMARYWDTLIKQ